MQFPYSLPFRLPGSPGIYRRFAICALIASLLTTGQDYLSALARQGGYYFSESLLFSSFWWIFPPLLWIQFQQAGRSEKKPLRVLFFWIALPIAAHLLLYPTLVESLGRLTMGHGFGWAGTLTYATTQYGAVLFLGYAVPLLVISLRRSTTERTPAVPEMGEQLAITTNQHRLASPDTIMVKEGTRTVIVPVADILLFSAASPYVKLHGNKRQFLVTETLRSLSAQLDPACFCRIHKSSIVQLNAVTEMRSRQNGDYDLILSDGSITRLSRSYVPQFRRAKDPHSRQGQDPSGTKPA